MYVGRKSSQFIWKIQINIKYLYTYNSYEPIEDECGGGVVGPVVEGRRRLVLPRVVAILEVRAPTWVQGSDGLWIRNILCRLYQ